MNIYIEDRSPPYCTAKASNHDQKKHSQKQYTSKDQRISLTSCVCCFRKVHLTLCRFVAGPIALSLSRFLSISLIHTLQRAQLWRTNGKSGAQKSPCLSHPLHPSTPESSPSSQPARVPPSPWGCPNPPHPRTGASSSVLWGRWANNPKKFSVFLWSRQRTPGVLLLCVIK